MGTTMYGIWKEQFGIYHQRQTAHITGDMIIHKRSLNPNVISLTMVWWWTKAWNMKTLTVLPIPILVAGPKTELVSPFKGLTCDSVTNHIIVFYETLEYEPPKTVVAVTKT
jgi:hypothetical protein